MQIQLKQLCLQYDCEGRKSDVLQDIDLQIGRGEFIGIMGRTGCGKTSLVQLMAGLLTPTSGQVLIDGEDINSMHYDKTILRGKLGYVFQYPEYQLFETTVYRDVAFALKYSKLLKKEVEARVRQALEDMGFDFEAIREESPLALSGGEKRRVAIAGVLAARPEILILDEPIAGLDPQARDAFLKLLKKLHAQGTTILMISHNADALADCVHRLIVINDGKKALDGTVEEVFSHEEVLSQMHLDVSFASRMSKKLALPHSVTYEAFVQNLKAKLGGDAQ